MRPIELTDEQAEQKGKSLGLALIAACADLTDASELRVLREAATSLEDRMEEMTVYDDDGGDDEPATPGEQP